MAAAAAGRKKRRGKEVGSVSDGLHGGEFFITKTDCTLLQRKGHRIIRIVHFHLIQFFSELLSSLGMYCLHFIQARAKEMSPV